MHLRELQVQASKYWGGIARLAGKQGEYPRNLKSMYKHEYPWKSVEPTKRKREEQYQSSQSYLNNESVYKEHYKPFYVTPQPKRKHSEWSRNNATFSGQTQYQRDYQQPKNCTINFIEPEQPRSSR